MPKPIPKNFFKKAQTVFGPAATFLYYYFPPLHPLVKIDPINLFDLRDLATDKAATIGRRGLWRDYVDLFFLIKDAYVKFPTVIAEAQKRFGADFAPKLFLEQLCYFDDIHDFTVEFIKERYIPNQIKSFFEKTVSEYSKAEL